MAIIQWRPRWGLRNWPGVWDWDWDEEFFGASMAVDLYEDKDNVVIKTDLPGIKEDAVDITIAGDQVTIKAEQKEEEEEKGKNYNKLKLRPANKISVKILRFFDCAVLGFGSSESCCFHPKDNTNTRFLADEPRRKLPKVRD